MTKRQPTNLTSTKQPGQVSAVGGQFSNFLFRQMPIWSNPQWLTAAQWREFVRKQPIAVLCRESITNYLISLDWKITAIDSEKQDELKSEIVHYTNLFEKGNTYYTSMDFTTHIEWIVKDLFDLPFGAASEIGREGDLPDGKVLWIRPLDAGTLSPTLDIDYPVVQHYSPYEPVYFAKEQISRIYLSPRTEIQREGWGMSPPERIYLAMEMLNRGDVYYAQLLLNTPEAGILDLGDMDGDSAREWVNSSRDLLFGINPLKIPVLYEHTTAAKWIPFGKLPSEILYDTITARYVTILCAGYGLTPSDIGMGSSASGGETLAGTIRQERISAKSGKAIAKKKVQAYFRNMLPDYLQFNWIDFDDEKNVAQSRARMANAQAGASWIADQVFSPDEIRRQAIADGLFTITLPETLDRSKIEWTQRTGRASSDIGKKGINEIGNPKAPSSGGHGDIIPQQIISRNRTGIEVSISKAVYAANQILGSLINSVKNEKNNFNLWERRFEDTVIGKSTMDLLSETIIDDAYNMLSSLLETTDWLDALSVELSKASVEDYNLIHSEDVQEKSISSIPPITMEDVCNQIVIAMKSQRESEESIKISAKERADEIEKEVQKRLSTIISNIPTPLDTTKEELIKAIENLKATPPTFISSPNVYVNVPEQASPNITNEITVLPSPASEPPVNNITVLPSSPIPAPVNNITVSPTPVEIVNKVENFVDVAPANVTVVKENPKTAKVSRDAEGRITEISTDS